MAVPDPAIPGTLEMDAGMFMWCGMGFYTFPAAGASTVVSGRLVLRLNMGDGVFLCCRRGVGEGRGLVRCGRV